MMLIFMHNSGFVYILNLYHIDFSLSKFALLITFNCSCLTRISLKVLIYCISSDWILSPLNSAAPYQMTYCTALQLSAPYCSTYRTALQLSALYCNVLSIVQFFRYQLQIITLLRIIQLLSYQLCIVLRLVQFFSYQLRIVSYYVSYSSSVISSLSYLTVPYCILQ